MDFKVAVVGFFVGMLVGLTGMGGGALMTPVLILFHWAKPVVAVGTDLMWGTLTKSVGAVVHYRQGTVNLKLVMRLAIGSVPGALMGIWLLHHLRERGVNIDVIITRILGVALICVALSLILRMFRGPRPRIPGGEDAIRGPEWLVSVVGALVGFIVSLTSVGSGSLIVACLVLIYPNTPLRRIVGSDIFHALILVGVSAIGHFGLGDLNRPLLFGLLLGSVPGVWIGSKMSMFFPEKVLRPILAATLFFLGYKLL
jgi:uncharacterized membrane protein YfcA